MTEVRDRSGPGDYRGFTATRTPPFDRYDLLLWAIPLAFVLALFAAWLAGIPQEVALTAGSAVGGGAIAHGVYLDPPVPEH